MLCQMGQLNDFLVSEDSRGSLERYSLSFDYNFIHSYFCLNFNSLLELFKNEIENLHHKLKSEICVFWNNLF